MAIIKSKQLKALSKAEAEKKIQELRVELMKEIKPGQGASIKNREIKKTIARLLTYHNHVMNSNVHGKTEARKGASENVKHK